MDQRWAQRTKSNHAVLKEPTTTEELFILGKFARLFVMKKDGLHCDTWKWSHTGTINGHEEIKFNEMLKESGIASNYVHGQSITISDMTSIEALALAGFQFTGAEIIRTQSQMYSSRAEAIGRK